MDLWIELGMDERIAELWRELGISAGTAIVLLFVIWGTLICRADFKSSLLYAALGFEIML